MSGDATVPSSSTPPPVPTAADFPEAGPNALAAIGQRGTARFMDVVLVFAPFTLWSLAYVRIEEDGTIVGTIPVWLAVANVAALIVYETVLVALWGRTLGKAAMGVRVARLVDGGRPSWSQSLLRAMVPATLYAVPVVGTALWVGVYLTSLGDDRRRGWHDRAGGTVVVRTR